MTIHQSCKIEKTWFSTWRNSFLRIKFHYNEGKIICTPPPRLCRFSLLATKYIFSSWLFFSFPNIAWKWMQMSLMQSSPFQQLVLLNIIIHRMIITLKHRVLHQLLKQNRAMIVPFTMLTINKSRGILEMTLPSHKRVSSKRLEKCLILQPNQPKAVC